MKIKIGVVYTSTTPELIDNVQKELINSVGDEISFVSFEDSSILNEIREKGYVTSSTSAKLLELYCKAILEGADVILNACSSVGEVADSVQSFSKYSGIPIIRIDEEMCREAVLRGKKIGVMATLSSTLNPTKNTILRIARETNKRVEIIECLIEGAFGLNQDEFKSKMLENALKISDSVDVILFAQGSMAYCENLIYEKCKKIVVSSPRFGAKAIKEALIKKGLL